MDARNYLDADKFVSKLKMRGNRFCLVRPLEPIFCPVCGRRLQKYGFEKRKVISKISENLILKSQRLRCKGCGIMFHFIPLSLVEPGLHYGTEYTKTVKRTGQLDKTCSADESTQRSWIKKSK